MRSIKILLVGLALFFSIRLNTTNIYAQTNCPDMSSGTTSFNEDTHQVTVPLTICITEVGNYKIQVIDQETGQLLANPSFTPFTIINQNINLNDIIPVPESTSFIMLRLIHEDGTQNGSVVGEINSIRTSNNNSASENSFGNAGVSLADFFLLGGTGSKKVSEVYNKPSVIANLLIKNLFIVAGILLFFVILFAGYKFVAQGTKGKDEAKTILTTAVTGFIVMFTAYWLIQIIQIITGTSINL